MKRNLALVCAAVVAASGHALTALVAPATIAAVTRGSGEAFSYVTEGSLFGACLQAVQLAEAPGVSFSKACADAFGKSGAQAALVSMDCAQLTGRVSEATDEHFLGDGRLLCGRLVRERSVAASRPLASFAPAEATASAVFCDVMKVEALPFCAPAAAAAISVLPPAAQPAATPALRAAEVKPVRLAVVAASPQLPQAAVQPVVQPAARLVPESVVTPQMSEAAQTIAAGVWPAFAHQVPQALAAGPSGLATAPMNTKAEQQPDLNNGGIWTNLAALLHRTG